MTATGVAAPLYDDPEAASLPEPEQISMPGMQAAAAAPAPAPIPQQAAPSMLPDPAAAAFEAARIAGEIVGDIESASGAAIVAAAAAGAAIEAARARSRAHVEGDPSMSGHSMPAISPADLPPSADLASGDPVVTVRMQRDRILRALAEDVAAQAAASTSGAMAETAAAAHEHGRAASQSSGSRAGSQVSARAASAPGARADTGDGPGSGVDSDVHDEDDLDPVQIASAAIQRLRHRASTDFAELRGHAERHDLYVVLLALVIIIVAGRFHAWMTTPEPKEFNHRGLVFEANTAFLNLDKEPTSDDPLAALMVEEIPAPPPRILRDPTGRPPKDSAYRVAFKSWLDPAARIEVVIDARKKSDWDNAVTRLELDRRTRWGALYSTIDSSVKSIEDQNWLRTEYRYAHVPQTRFAAELNVDGSMPRVDEAVEYATTDKNQIYVVTFFGRRAEIDRLEHLVAPTLRIVTKDRSSMPLGVNPPLPSVPPAIARAFHSTVMVVVADLVDGRLQARGGGSGIVVSADGSILTNYHVIHDSGGRLHDAFVIGRFCATDQAPQLICAGRPNRSKLQKEIDLVLIKCDTDLDGRTFVPSTMGIWATLPEARMEDVRIGQHVWVLGYPDVNGGNLTATQGQVLGWTGPGNTEGRDFIKTDAQFSKGNSGGPMLDDHGRLIGIASAIRITKASNGGTTETLQQRGLARPLASATDLLAIAATGWTPREGRTDVELEPSALEARAEGVHIQTTIRDAANEAPIRDALVMVMRPGIRSGDVDVNRLDDQVIAFGRSNAQGDVELKQPVPVPGTYTVMVVARGYEAVIGEDSLRLDANTPAVYDPWNKGLRLRSR